MSSGTYFSVKNKSVVEIYRTWKKHQKDKRSRSNFREKKMPGPQAKGWQRPPAQGAPEVGAEPRLSLLGGVSNKSLWHVGQDSTKGSGRSLLALKAR